MRKILIIMALMAVMLGAGMKLWAEKGPLGKECRVDGFYVSESDLMEALFGNYQPRIQASAFDPARTADPELLKWRITSPLDSTLEDWAELEEYTQEEFRAMQDKIPLRYLKHYRFPNNRMLVAFEAGQWMYSSDQWGGMNFTGSHNLGMAAFTLVSDGWMLTGYDLDLGRFGAYCTTTLGDDPVRVGENEYGVMTQDYGRGIFTIMDGDPVLLLRVPHFHGYGHGDPESFDSVISFAPGENKYYDVVVETTGINYDTGASLSFRRRWVWDAASERYLLKESGGNVQNILDDPDYWLLDDF